MKEVNLILFGGPHRTGKTTEATVLTDMLHPNAFLVDTKLKQEITTIWGAETLNKLINFGFVGEELNPYIRSFLKHIHITLLDLLLIKLEYALITEKDYSYVIMDRSPFDPSCYASFYNINIINETCIKYNEMIRRLRKDQGIEINADIRMKYGRKNGDYAKQHEELINSMKNTMESITEQINYHQWNITYQ